MILRKRMLKTFKKMTMMKRNKINVAVCAAVVLLGFGACQTPQATVVKSDLKERLLKGDSTHKATQDTLLWWKRFDDTTLQTLIDTALANNHDVKMAVQDLAMAKSAILAKEGALRPVLSGKMGLGLSKVGRYTAEGAGNASTEMTPGHNIPTVIPDWAPGVQLDWTIDLWHKLQSDKKAAVERYLASEAGQRAVRNKLVAEVVENYYTLLALDEKREVMLQYVALQKKAVQLAKIQKEADAGTQLAVEKFAAEVAKGEADECELREEIAAREHTLNLLLGRLPQAVERKPKDFAALPLPSAEGALAVERLLARADVVQAEHELAAAKWDVETARKEFLPQLNVSAALGVNAFNPKYLVRLPESLVWNAVGNLTAPLINKRAIRAQFAQADAQQLNALFNYEKTLLGAFVETHAALSKLEHLSLVEGHKREQYAALTRAVSAAQQLYANNRASYLEVNDSEREQLDCRLSLIDQKLEQLSTLIGVFSSR